MHDGLRDHHHRWTRYHVRIDRRGARHGAVGILSRGCGAAAGRYRRCDVYGSSRGIFGGRSRGRLLVGASAQETDRYRDRGGESNVFQKFHSRTTSIGHTRGSRPGLRSSCVLSWSSGRWSKASGRTTVELDQIRTRFLYRSLPTHTTLGVMRKLPEGSSIWLCGGPKLSGWVDFLMSYRINRARCPVSNQMPACGAGALEV